MHLQYGQQLHGYCLSTFWLPCWSRILLMMANSHDGTQIASMLRHHFADYVFMQECIESAIGNFRIVQFGYLSFKGSLKFARSLHGGIQCLKQ